MVFALMIGLTSCGSDKKDADAQNNGNDRVEVIYFHGKQRCATCMAIEKSIGEVINSRFAKELKNGTLVFRTVDISTPEGEELADKYEVTWSSLYVNTWKDGKETRSDMTEFAFNNARNNPDAFKNELADKISQSLK